MLPGKNRKGVRMKTIKIPRTELTVSALNLGTTQFGTIRSEEESFRQMDIYLSHTAPGGSLWRNPLSRLRLILNRTRRTGNPGSFLPIIRIE